MEKKLGLTINKYVQFWTEVPIVNFNHIYAIDPLEVRRKKRMAPLRAYDIPHWGSADVLVQNFQ